ncbi:MAG: hypothetical protein FE048_01670 [Thermoplasmata archaeon]|nr:MAG: hypothetical protein FE048_01670 [Thermoplasmata archaeon]
MRKRILFCLFIISILPLANAMPIKEWRQEVYYRNITIFAPAVAKTNDGYVGVLTQINVTMQNGSGNVYVVTSPLTEIDMQGSAHLAVDVASALTGIDTSNHDFIFVVKADSPIVGGPSAGAVMTIAAIALIKGWETRDDVIMTGMINPDGSIGPVGGILEKGEAAANAGANYFLIPKGQGIVYQTITETKRIGGFVQIIQKRVPINVSSYLGNKYGIVVKEVEDINEALQYFTGYTFPEKKSSQPMTTEDYESIMRPLAIDLIEKANNSYKKADSLFENCTSQGVIPPGYWWENPRAEIRNALNDALQDLQIANTACNNYFYYYSISKSFQSLINSRFVKYACEYYLNGGNGDYFNSIYANVTDMVNKALSEAKKAKIEGMVSLQCVGAAQIRALDALNNLNESMQYWNKFSYSFKSSDVLSSLSYLAYAAERSKTAHWWLDLANYFNDTFSINDAWLEGMVNKYYDYASQIVTYANILISESGASSSFIQKAQTLLNQAANEKEYPAASLFLLLESIANANIAIEAIDGVDESNVERTSQMASYSIQQTRNESIEPVMAVSYYEFGRSIERDSLNDALRYYKYSYMISNMLRLGTGYEEEEASYVGFLPVKEKNRNTTNYVLEGIIGSICFIGGIAIGRLTLRKKGKEEIKNAEEGLRYLFD